MGIVAHSLAAGAVNLGMDSMVMNSLFDYGNLQRLYPLDRKIERQVEVAHVFRI
jgi:hypothetical protein